MAAQGETLAQIQLAGEWSSTSAPFSHMNTDIADKSPEIKRIVEAELQYDPVDDLEEEGESESGKEGRQEVWPAPLLPGSPGLRVRYGTLRPGRASLYKNQWPSHRHWIRSAVCASQWCRSP